MSERQSKEKYPFSILLPQCPPSAKPHPNPTDPGEWKTQTAGTGPCDSEQAEKGYGIALSANWPGTGMIQSISNTVKADKY